MIYRFNNTVLNTENFLLSVDGVEIPVEPQVFNLIVFLIEHANQVVSREDLLDHVWKGRIVSDTSINNNIKSARQALGDDGSKQQVIKTIHSRGYQFVAELKTSKKAQSDQPALTIINKTSLSTVVIIGFTVIMLLAILWIQNNNSDSDNQINQADQVHHQKLITVLPFTNTKPDLDTDYLGFALANQVIGDLTYLENYSIRPAGSIRKYAGQIIDPIAIGEALQVDYVINGNYLIENDIIRLNVEMIEVANNQLVWRESMQVNFSNTFSLQDMVAQKVAKGLNVGFKQDYLNQQHRDIPNSALAFEYYLRGISYPQSNEGHKLAIKMLQKSIELDPQYAPSYAHLGFHRRLLEQHGRIVPSGLKKAEWYYQKALELNPDQLDALSNLSALYVETNRIEDALLITRKMIEIDPNDANSHFALGYIYRYAGMLDEAIAAMETALKISPNNTRFRSIISTYNSAGKHQEALAKVHLDPGDYGTGYSGIIAFEQEQYELAKELFNQVIEIDENGIWGLIAQVYLAVMDDDNERGMAALSQMVDTDVIDAENIYYFAGFYALLNEQEKSLEMLELAINSGYFNYPHISHNAAFNFLQDNPRYISILQKAKLRHEAFRLKFL